jgi:hypothetical protein
LDPAGQGRRTHYGALCRSPYLDLAEKYIFHSPSVLQIVIAMADVVLPMLI